MVEEIFPIAEFIETMYAEECNQILTFEENIKELAVCFYKLTILLYQKRNF